MKSIARIYPMIFLLTFVTFLIGCIKIPGDLTPIIPAKELPAFATQKNEIEIADLMNDVDPTWVLGSIVVIETGEVHGFENYLSPTAKPLITPQSEIVFKDFIENSLVISGSWLDFLSAKVSNNVKAELSVIKASKVTVNRLDINGDKLRGDFRQVSVDDKTKYGVLIGYVDFVLSAGLYKNIGFGAQGGGYGVKIGTDWFSKFENTSVQHRTIAVWSPLPLILDQVSQPAAARESLEAATQRAIERLPIRRVVKKPSFRLYIERQRIP